MTWIHDVPLWVFGLGTFSIFAFGSFLGLYVTHRSVRRLSKGLMIVDNGVVGWFFSGVMVLYSVTLGLVAVATWQGMTQVSGIASSEAASIAALYRDTTGYPEPLRTLAHTELRDYLEFIIERAWPAQRQGIIDNGSSAIINRLQQTLFTFKPADMGEQVIQMEVLRQFNNVVELRRQRIEAVGQGIPNVLWLVVLGGAALCIVFSFAFKIDDFRLQALMTMGLAVTIGLLVFLIGALDQPYRGDVSVEPTAYQLLLDMIIKAQQAQQ